MAENNRIFWDDHPDFKTSAMLFANTLEGHYAVLKKVFADEDTVLDVGCGNGIFGQYVKSVGVDETTDLITFDLSLFNTLHFSESIGYISNQVIERLISYPTIRKIVIKDFICTEPIKTQYFNYETTKLSNIVIPLLCSNNYRFSVQPFAPNRNRWIAILQKHNLVYTSYPETENVLVIAER